jgi:hypothetical protein
MKNGDTAILADAERLRKFRKNGEPAIRGNNYEQNGIVNCESAGGRVAEIDVEIHQAAIFFKREKVGDV